MKQNFALNCALSFALLLAFIGSLSLGPVKLAPFLVIKALYGEGEPIARLIVSEIRLPRALLSLMIGGALGLCGAAMQGLMRNPLAAPSLFGAPQAAAFGAVAAISLGYADALSFALPVAAICGALLSVVLLVFIAGQNASLLIFILSGMALSSLAGAGTALALNLAPNPFAALEISFWLLGSLEDRSFQHVAMAAPFIGVGIIMLLARAAPLRLLTLGEDVAQSLGLNVKAFRLYVIVAVALSVGASVAVAGTIGFIGLVVPHLLRPLVGHDPARLLLPSALGGALLLSVADCAVRLIPATTDIKVGVLTSLIGVPFFFIIIRRHKGQLGGGLS